MSREAKLSLWAELWPSCWGTNSIQLKIVWCFKNITKKDEDYENSPLKYTHCCLSVMERQWYEWVAKLSLWAVFSLLPWQHSEYFIKIKLDLVKKKKGEWNQNSCQKYTRYFVLLLARWWCWAGGETQSVDRVLAVPMVGPQLFNWGKVEMWLKHL